MQLTGPGSLPLPIKSPDVLDWPAKSPDLNSIEQVWDELGSHVRRNHAIHIVNDLAAALQIPIGFVVIAQNLI